MNSQEWTAILLLFTRLSALIVVVPFFSWRGVPALMKAGFAGVFAYLLFLAKAPAAPEIPPHIFFFLLAVGSEALFGLTLGFLVLLIFAAVRVAGQIIDIKAGFMMASLVDPQFGGQVTLFGQFYYLFSLVFYLSLGGHHMLFLALSRSVDILPLGGAVFSPQILPQVMQFVFQMFLVAFQLAAPVAAVLIFSDVVLGLLSKTVPQIHVFMVGMPLKAGVALLIIYLIFPYATQVMESGFLRMQQDIFRLFGLL